MAGAEASHRAVARWTSRAIPAILAGILGYGTYVVVARVCVDYLYGERRESGVVIAVLILFFLFFLFSVTAYIRTLWIINTDTGLVPLVPRSKQAADERTAPTEARRNSRDVESHPHNYWGADRDPDSPGLEIFYSKEAFICESDGRPRWCSECRNWKPDRAHHSSEIGRCVRKMDHYCPWVGGMVSETSFKFFVQFTFYCALLCGVILAASAYSLARQIQEGRSVDGQIIAAVAASSFFGMFTFMMTVMSLRFIFLNVTNIDMLKKAWVYQLAVRIPQGTRSTEQFATITYPLAPTPSHPTRESQVNAVSEPATGSPDNGQPESTRDRLATRTFAILRTEPDENPWDLGWRANWVEVMGKSVMDWLLPIRRSPCAEHDEGDTAYPMEPVLAKLRARYGLVHSSREEADAVELREMRRREFEN